MHLRDFKAGKVIFKPGTGAGAGKIVFKNIYADMANASLKATP